MSGSANISSGFAGLLRAIVSNVVAILHGRLELFSVELQEERHRLLRGLIWASAGIVSGSMAFVLINVTIVYLFWEDARLTVLLSLTAFYTVIVVAILVGFRKGLRRKRIPFADTLHELQKDYECFQRRN